ncbi:MAG: hypothetical protein ABH919_02785 [bacterium]
MNIIIVIIIYLLLFVLTSYIAYKKGGVWSKSEGEGFAGIVLKSFVLWIYLAGLAGIIISYFTLQENSAYFLAEGRNFQANFESSLGIFFHYFSR